jgi:hypothetical protein
MTQITVLFDTPQNEIASKINQLLDSSTDYGIFHRIEMAQRKLEEQ